MPLGKWLETARDGGAGAGDRRGPAGKAPLGAPGKDQNLGEAAELLLGITGNPEGAQAPGAAGGGGGAPAEAAAAVGGRPAGSGGGGGGTAAGPRGQEAAPGPGNGSGGGSGRGGGGGDDGDDDADIVSSGTPFEMSKDQRIARIDVRCNDEKAVYHVAEQMIEFKGQMLQPQKFEKIAGKGGSRKWRFSIKCLDPSGEEFPLGLWLQHQIKNDVKLARPESVDKKQAEFIQWSGDSVEITCNKNPALFELSSKTVLYEGERLPPLRFETMSGKGRFRNWKRSFIVKETGQSLGVWLKARGIVFGRTKDIDFQNDTLRAEINQKSRQKEVEDAMVALAAIKEDPTAHARGAKGPAKVPRGGLLGATSGGKKKKSKKKSKKKKKKQSIPAASAAAVAAARAVGAAGEGPLGPAGAVDTFAKCTVCCKTFPPCDTMSHPHLGVVVCARCHSDVATTSFQTGEDGNEDFCRWCAAGGDWAFCCDFCPASFCKNCVDRNLGQKELERISTADKWACYLCNAKPLKAARDVNGRFFNWAKRGRLRNFENPAVPMGVAPLRQAGPPHQPLAGSPRSAAAHVPDRPMVEWSRGQFFKAEVVAKESTRVLVRFTERPDLEPEYLLRSDPRIWSGSLDSSCWHTLSQHVWEPLEEAGREGAAAPSGVKRPREGPTEAEVRAGELPQSVDVECKGLAGKFFVASQSVLHKGRHMHPMEFGQLAGNGGTRKWKVSLKVDAGGGEQVALGQWLDAKGIRLPALPMYKPQQPPGSSPEPELKAPKRGRPAKKARAEQGPGSLAAADHAPLPLLPFLSDAAAQCWRGDNH